MTTADAHNARRIAAAAACRYARAGSLAHVEAEGRALVAAICALRAHDGRGSRRGRAYVLACRAAVDGVRTVKGRRYQRPATVLLDDAYAAPERPDTLAEITQAMDRLSTRERVVVAGLFRGETQPEIGRRLGVTPGRVSQITTAMRKRMD